MIMKILGTLLKVGFAKTFMLLVMLNYGIIVISLENIKVLRHFDFKAHRDFNCRVKSNHKTPILFHNLKNHDPHLIVKELTKFEFMIHVTPNEVEK